MRKGFSVSLATVAFATLGFQAMAMAPTIGDIPDIVVGGPGGATGSNVFVFPDAVNLDTKVTDDDTTPGQIIWSYSVTDPTNPTTQVYSLNGADPVVLATESRVTPPAAKRISSQDSDPAKVDANARTITIRNVKRSPLPAQTSYPSAGGPGILTADTKVVTLHASDGSTASSKNILIYTDVDGADRFSPDAEIVANVDFTTGGGADWQSGVDAFTAPTFNRGSNGLCITSTANTQVLAKWFSSYGFINLASNSVYEARFTVRTNQTTVGQTPAFALEYDNISTAGNQGQNEFGGKIVMIDNEGGAVSPNATVGRTGDQNYTFFISPVQAQTPQFMNSTSGFFRPDLDPHRGMRLHFRMYQTAAIPNQATLNGSLCLEDVIVERHDISDKTVTATPFQLTSFSTTNGAANQIGIDQVGSATTLTVDTGNASVTLRPSASWDNVASTFRPGDTTVNFSSPTGNENRDNWPVAWKSETIYYIEFELSAPTATDEQNMPDAILVGADSLAGEVTVDNYCVPNTIDPAAGGWPAQNRGVSTPRTGTPQKYGVFWHSLTQSKSNIVDSDRIRPKLIILGAPALTPAGRTDNTGGFRIHAIRVQEVTF